MVGAPFRPCVREWSPPLCSDSQPARVTSLPRASLAVCPPPPPPPVLGTKKPAKQPAIEAPGRAIAPAIARFISRRLPMSGTIAPAAPPRATTAAPRAPPCEKIEYEDSVEYREVPIDTYIEVPEVEYRYKQVEVKVPEPYFQEVPQYKYTEVPMVQVQEVERVEQVPVPVDVAPPASPPRPIPVPMQPMPTMPVQQMQMPVQQMP